MKKTNVALLSSAARWLKMLPLLLGFALFCSSDLAAQVYLPADEAAVAVKQALEPIQSSLPSEPATQGLSHSEHQTIISWTYYTQFLEFLSEVGNTQQAMQRLDEAMPVSNQSQRKEFIQEARADLMDLITE